MKKLDIDTVGAIFTTTIFICVLVAFAIVDFIAFLVIVGMLSLFFSAMGLHVVLE